MGKLKQLFCNHQTRLSIEDVYMSVGDEYNKIKSTKFTLICSNCGKKIEIFDKHKYYITKFLDKYKKENS